MKIENIISERTGRPVANQFTIKMDNGDYYFQSYRSMIVKISQDPKTFERTATLDRETWDYSNTTRKYRNIFLGEDSKTIKEKVRLGIYKLEDLNK